MSVHVKDFIVGSISFQLSKQRTVLPSSAICGRWLVHSQPEVVPKRTGGLLLHASNHINSGLGLKVS